jgi:hypothetical protein
MTTFTGSVLTSSVKEVHTGVIVAGGNAAIGATATAGSVILMNNLPDGATLVDFWLRYTTNETGATNLIELGTSATPSGIMPVTSLTYTWSQSASISIDVFVKIVNVNIRAPGGSMQAKGVDLMPVHISLSDDVQPSHVMIQAELNATISASALLSWCLFYTMDLPGHTTIR